jgi:GNAT superfamily N-acetyltransferase
MSGVIVIRPMHAGDIPPVCVMVEQLTGHAISADAMAGRLQWAVDSPFDWLFVAELDEQVCGLLGFRLRERIEHPSRYGEISVLVTDTAVRRHGVGRALVDYAEQMARDHACCGTWLVSGFKRKDEAHRFYSALGYDITGYRFVKLFED